MAFVPDSVIHLLRVNIDNTYKNQITFSDEYKQYSYFYQNRKFTEDGLTYQRKDSVIMWPAHIDTLWEVNYCMYRNSNFSNKWFYAFISKMEYVNDECTAITIETDVWQTWYFQILIKESFIEREHVNNDAIGANLTPENLETGEYITTGYDTVDMGVMQVIIATVQQPDAENGYSGGGLVDGVYSGLEYTFFDTTEINQINSFIQAYADIGHLDYIVAVFMCPRKIANSTVTPIQFKPQLKTVGGYTPKNNKLFIYPYNMIVVSNNKGSMATFHIEKFNPTGGNLETVYFVMDGAFSMQPTAILRPQDYKGELHNWDEGIILAGFPQCSWVGDIFSNWYAQNKASIFTNLASGLVSSGMQVISGNVAGGIVSGVSGVANTLATMYDHSVAPLQINGQVAGDSSNVSWNRALYTMKNVQIQAEFAEKIDNFFSMFGYAVGKVKVPNITGRPNWNFVKTQEINILGNIPNEDMVTIKDMFNRGVTFWHNGDIVGDYSLPNSINSPPVPPPDPEPEPEPAEEMIVPVDGGMTGITSEFGWRDYPPDPYHTGIDFARAKGSNIYAALSGTILWTKIQTTGFGIHIKIDHGNGLTTMYAHCLDLTKKQGDKIIQGDIIAHVDSTGLSTGHHLHFQVEVNGTPVNPRVYLPN